MAPLNPFQLAYKWERARLEFPAAAEAAVAALATAVEAALPRGSGVSIGSARHGTYAALPPDFDAIVLTEQPQEALDRDQIRGQIATLLAPVAAGEAFAAYCEALDLAAPRRLQLRSLEPDGRYTLLARIDLESAGCATEWLDLSFGRLYRAVGLENWWRRYFASLSAEAQRNWQLEVRLTKCLFEAVGGIYHTRDHGLRAHTIEQWLTQAPGGPTLANLMRHIAEEGQGLGFAEFRRRYPVWHPGVNEPPALGQGYAAFNMLELLGDGDDVLAESQWRRLFAVAADFDRRRRAGEDWSLSALAQPRA